MENFCVKVWKTKDACEVVASALANGSELGELPHAMSGDDYTYFGVYEGKTECGCVGNELSMDQLRAQYPLPCERSAQSEWDGTELPPVGIVCEMSGPNDGKWYEAEILAHRDGFAIGWSGSFGGVLYSNDIYDFRQLRTERELFIVAAADAMRGAGIVLTGRQQEILTGAIWDAGLGKLPEEYK